MPGEDGGVELADEVLVDVVMLVVAERERLRVKVSICAALSRKPPWRPTASISLSKTSETAKTCFSPMQSRLLSNAAPATIDFAAFSMSAVASTTTGGLPGPATTARRLLASAARATAGPPGDDQELDPPVVEQGGGRLQGGRLDDRDQVVEADRLADRPVEPADPLGGDLGPEGWALTTTVLPAASMLMALPARVGRLCVTGVIAPMTPNGA